MDKYIPDDIISFSQINEFLKSMNKPILPYDEIDLTNKSIEQKEEVINKSLRDTQEWLMKYIGIIEK